MNTSLLMTVNLSGRSISGHKFVGSLAKKFFDDISLSMLSLSSQDLFRYGLFRILAWAPIDPGRNHLMPRSICMRRAPSAVMETFADVTEVAGSSRQSLRPRFRRWSVLDMEEHLSINGPTEKAHKSRLDPRSDGPPLPDLHSFFPSVTAFRRRPWTHEVDFVDRFLELDDRLKEQDPDLHQRFTQNPRRKLRKKENLTDLHAEYGEMRRLAQYYHATHMRGVDLVAEARQLSADWKDAVRSSDGRALDSAVELQLRDRAVHVQHRIQKLNLNLKSWVEKGIDDCRAIDMSPPVLSWSRRKQDPLLVHDREFGASGRRMAFYDVVPKAGPLTKLDSFDKAVSYRHVIGKVFSYPTASVAAALKLLVHESGMTDFVQTIPGIHDPSKGGWYDLDQLRMRALPADLLLEIALAYERWPFRPKIEDFLLAVDHPQALWTDEDEHLK
jgi:hypothetical protein